MFKKILVVEDLDSIGLGLAIMLEREFGTEEVVMSQYCNDAYRKYLKALNEGDPFDLLITDLSFTEDYRESSLKNGAQLIEKIRKEDQKIPIIVYSVEERPLLVKRLLEKFMVSAYVLKGRNGLKYMAEATRAVLAGRTYLSTDMEFTLKRKTVFEMEDYDLSLLSHLSNGLTQDEISQYFSKKGITPCSLSSIEKRLNRLKEELQAKNTIQLISNAKDLGLI